MKASMKVMILVMMTGRELMKKPYNIQRKIPAQNSMNIPIDMSFVDLVIQVLITCGKNEMVVRVPAAMPRSVTVSMIPIVPSKAAGSNAAPIKDGAWCAVPRYVAVIVYRLAWQSTPTYRDKLHCRTRDPDVSDRSDAALSNSYHDHNRGRTCMPLRR